KGAVLAAKVREKYGQLRSAREPVVLFFGQNIAVNDSHLQSMVRRIVQDPDDARILSAIVFSETFHAQGFKLWINPNANFSLSEEAVAELRRLFSAEDFRVR